MTTPSRRLFLLKSAGFSALGSLGPAAAAPAQAPAAAAAPPAYVFLNPAEARFVEAAVERLIPGDETGPGALDAAVPVFIDRQLAGAWGHGEKLYRSGPFHDGTPSQGYQLPYTPAELFRRGARGLAQDLSRRGQPAFEQLAPQDRDRTLTALQNGEHDLDGVPSKVFFDTLWELTVEGFFSDPAYGGNRDMVGWRLIGFPGAYANYHALVDQPNLAFTGPPLSMGMEGALKGPGGHHGPAGTQAHPMSHGSTR